MSSALTTLNTPSFHTPIVLHFIFPPCEGFVTTFLKVQEKRNINYGDKLIDNKLLHTLFKFFKGFINV